MTFETFQGPPDNRSARKQAQLTVRADLSGYLNAAADVQYYRDTEELVFLTDTEAMQLAVADADTHDGYAYSANRGTDRGLEVYLGTVLKHFGITSDDVESSTYLDLEWRDDIDAGVVDLTPLVDDEDTEPAEPAAPVDLEDADEVECTNPSCSDTFDTEQGMKIHRGRVHDSPRSEVEQNGAGEQAEQDDDLLTRQARSFVEEKGLRKLSALAEALEVSEGQARKHARAADVYGSLKDDTVSRPGVGD